MAQSPSGKDEFTGFRRNLWRLFEVRTNRPCRDFDACDISTPAGYQSAAEKRVSLLFVRSWCRMQLKLSKIAPKQPDNNIDGNGKPCAAPSRSSP